MRFCDNCGINVTDGVVLEDWDIRERNYTTRNGTTLCDKCAGRKK